MSAVVDIAALAPGLQKRDPGIWFADSTGDVSYPPGANALYAEIESGSFWFSHRNRCISSIIQQYPPGGAVLDIGGGNGYVSCGLQAAGVPCILLEPGLHGALAAHRRGIAAVICARFEDVRFSPASLEAAGLFDVLEHFPDDSLFLSRLSRSLKVGARLYITVPAYQFLFSSVDANDGHFRRYNLSALHSLLDEAGFDVEYSTYIFWPLPPLIFIQRVLRDRLTLGRRETAREVASEHAARGLTRRLLDWTLGIEIRRLARGKSMPFGGSCLVCARKQ